MKKVTCILLLKYDKVKNSKKKRHGGYKWQKKKLLKHKLN